MSARARQGPWWAVPGWVVLLLQAACAASTPRVTHYAQSMNSAVDGCLRNPACVTSTPGDEALIPWLSRAAQTARAVATLKEFLEEADLRLIEKVLIDCAQEADAQINAREYGPDRYPDDAECNRLVRDKDGKEVSRASELGVMKHEGAFACVRRRLLAEFPDNVSVEPRYGWDPATRRYTLTSRWSGSLKPDVVLHFARDPNRVQCAYDFKFPCTLAKKRDPLSMEGVQGQLELYDRLGGNCPSAIVTPQLGINP